jgi:acetyl esterase/lipase
MLSLLHKTALLSLLAYPALAPAVDLEKREQVFVSCDANGDLSLDAYEIGLLLRAMQVNGKGLLLTPKRLLRRFDGNDDGLVSRAEMGLPAQPPPRQAAAGTSLMADIPYASIPEVRPALLSLDMHSPEGLPPDAARPVLVFIHGGGWAHGDKRGVADKPVWMAGRNGILVSINYRLSPAVIHPAHVEDVAAAIAWVHANIAEYGGDPGRIALIGHSAGAHLAALVASDERRLAEHGLTPRLLSGVILLDGAGFDLPKRMASMHGAWKTIFEAPFTDDAAVQKDASPLHHVAEGDRLPPFLITVSSQRAVAVSQAQDLTQAIQAIGAQASLASFDKNHQEMNQHCGLPRDALTKTVDGFLDNIWNEK